MINYVKQFQSGMLLKNIGAPIDIWKYEEDSFGTHSFRSTNEKIKCNGVFSLIQVDNEVRHGRIKINILYDGKIGWLFCDVYLSNEDILMQNFEEVC